MDDDLKKRSQVLKNVGMGLGTWAWGDRLFWGYGREYNDDDLKKAFLASIQQGVNFFDTAEVYGQGKSELLLGRFVEEIGADVKLASKFMPFPWRLSKKSLLRALKKSMKRLGVNYIDLYQMHMPVPPITLETWMDAMSEAYQAGLIKAVGVSNYNREQLQRAYETLARQGVELASCQVEYSLLNREIEQNGVKHLCDELEVSIIAYSPLAQGLLTGKYSSDQPPHGIRGRQQNRNYLERIRPLITEMRRIGADHAGKPPVQVALNWLIAKGAIPIPGAKTEEQAIQNAEALTWTLTFEEIKKLDYISDQIHDRKTEKSVK